MADLKQQQGILEAVVGRRIYGLQAGRDTWLSAYLLGGGSRLIFDPEMLERERV